MTRAVDMADPPTPQQQSHGDNASKAENSELKRALERLVHLIPDEGDCSTKVLDKISRILAMLKNRKPRSQNDKSENNSKPFSEKLDATGVVATGQTYDRESIQERLDAGHRTCPEPSASDETNSGTITPKGKNCVTTLVDKLSVDHQQRREAAGKLRVFTRTYPSSRAYIGEVQIIPTLISQLSPDLETQEHVVTTLMNLAIHKANQNLIAEKGGIPPIVEVLRSGNMAARGNAATALFLLSEVDKNKAQIGACGAIPLLVELLRDGNTTGKKDAASALRSLCADHPDNKSRSVRAGLVPVLLEFMRSPEEAMGDLYLSILTILSRSEEGRKAIGDAGALPLLMEYIKAEGCPRKREYAVNILSALCSSDTRYLEEVKNSDGGAGYKQALTDLRLTGTPRARRTASALIDRIRRGPFTLGFIGAGKMSEAIARGLDKSGILPSSRMRTADARLPRREAFASFGVTVMESNSKVVEECEVIVLGMKPQFVKEVLIDLKPILSDAKLLVSIAAGVKLKDLEEWAGKARVVRVMPNTPCLVGESAAVMSLGEKATAEDEKLVKGLFEAVGKIWTAKEKLLDAITGLSGSGPAYIYLAIEALADGGVAAGLPQELASSLVPQTVLGAAKMVMDTKKRPGQLKDEVLSPAGTTIAGIHELEKGGFRATLMSAVIAAAKRSEELSKT